MIKYLAIRRVFIYVHIYIYIYIYICIERERERQRDYTYIIYRLNEGFDVRIGRLALRSTGSASAEHP